MFLYLQKTLFLYAIYNLKHTGKMQSLICIYIFKKPLKQIMSKEYIDKSNPLPIFMAFNKIGFLYLHKGSWFFNYVYLPFYNFLAPLFLLFFFFCGVWGEVGFWSFWISLLCGKEYEMGETRKHQHSILSSGHSKFSHLRIGLCSQKAHLQRESI